MQLTRRKWLGLAAGVTAAALRPVLQAASPQSNVKFRDLAPWSLYAFDNGLNGPDVPTIESKVRLLKNLGYAGMTDHFNLHRLPKILEELDRHGLEFASLYYTPKVEDDLDPNLREAIRLLKGRRARIEIGFISSQFKPSDPAADARATESIMRIVDWVGDTGPLISIYPHKGFWTERVEDGLRLARKVGLNTVGTNFNLVHYQWVTPRKALPELLAEAMPHLFLVTINGLAGNDIVSLADGDYDLYSFLLSVKKAGYKGPIGLQCYSVKGPSETHLRKSMLRWRQLKQSLGV